MKLVVIKTAVLAIGLIGMTSSAFAEKWGFDNNASGTGDPLTYTGSAGNGVSVSGFIVNKGTGIASPDGVAIDYGTNGIGVDTDGRGSDPHTLGNNNTNHFDGVLLDFGTKLADLSRIKLTSNDGWDSPFNDDADQDFAAYYWSGTGSAALPTSTYNQASGTWNNWVRTDLKDSSVDGAWSDTNAYNINSGGAKSTSWMIVAANTDKFYDAYKFKWVKGDISDCVAGQPGCGPSGGTPIPVPGTLMLLSLGLLGARRFMKK